MNEWDNFRKFVDIQKGRANYNEWKKGIEEAASQISKEELENDIKKYEIDYQKKKVKLQSSTTFGVCSYYVSLVVLFITTLASGIYSIYNTSNSVAISLMNLEQDKKEEAMNIVGKNINYQTEFISVACVWIIVLSVIIFGVFIAFKVYENHKVNKLLFLEEKIKILKEVTTRNM